MEYGYFCEDIALEVFVESVLTLFKKELQKGEDFFNDTELPVDVNDGIIEKKHEEVSRIAIICKVKLYIVARDYDEMPVEQYGNYIKSRKDKLDIRIRNRTVFCVPVKCIEYWLYYLKHMDDTNPPQPESLENDLNFNCNLAKKDVYDGKLDAKRKYNKQSRSTEKAKAEAILKKLDIKRLRELSPSFDNFMKQLEAVNYK